MDRTASCNGLNSADSSYASPYACVSDAEFKHVGDHVDIAGDQPLLGETELALDTNPKPRISYSLVGQQNS
jgi:hypothetical protein